MCRTYRLREQCFSSGWNEGRDQNSSSFDTEVFPRTDTTCFRLCPLMSMVGGFCFVLFRFSFSLQ